MAIYETHYKCRIHGWLAESEVDKTTIDFRCSRPDCGLAVTGHNFPVKDQEVACA